MILYGRNLSPYVRRVAIWAALQGRPMERRELSPFDDADAVAAANPMMRTPTLTLDDDTVLIESWAICDWLDETAPEKRVLPASGPARRLALRRMAMANAATEIAQQLFYERGRRPAEKVWDEKVARLARQLKAGLDELEKTVPASGLFGGGHPDAADICFAVATDFVRAVAPETLESGREHLVAHAERCAALSPFASTRP